MKTKLFIPAMFIIATSIARSAESQIPTQTTGQTVLSPNVTLPQPIILRRGLPNVARKLTNNEDVSVVFLGGSVTEGGGADGYVAKVGDWLRQRYPQSKIKIANAGIGGTNSDYGWQRMERDVLVHNPDLLVVEYAVNDGGPNSTRSMEALVRKSWESNPFMDIVFMYHTHKSGLPSYAANQWPETVVNHEKVASYYDIPSIGTGFVLAAKVNAGEAKWEDLITDAVHPRASGYAIYTQVITDALKVMLASGKVGPVQLSTQTLTPNLVVNLPPFVPTAMPESEPFFTKAGEKAQVTYVLPTVGVHWANEPEYKANNQVLWRLNYQSTDVGKKLNAGVGLDRSQWKGTMAYFRGGNAFCANQPKASPLAKVGPDASGTTLGAKEATMGILSFIAPEAGRYVFSLRSNGVTLWSHHKAIAMNVVHFPVGQNLGTSVAFGSTTVEEKANLNLEFPVALQGGDEVAFEVDTNADGGGGGAYWEGLNLRVGYLGK